jgi:chaperonin GroES
VSPARKKAGKAPARKGPQRGSPPRSAASRSTDTRDKGETRMPKVRPLRDRIMVRRIEEAEQKSGGIIVPDTAKEKPQQAEVVAVGSGRVLDSGQTVPLSVKAGDKVLVGKWSGSDVKIDGEEYLILKEDEVLGVIQ